MLVVSVFAVLVRPAGRALACVRAFVGGFISLYLCLSLYLPLSLSVSLSVCVCVSGMGGVCGAEHGHQRPPADARVPLLREENENSVRQGGCTYEGTSKVDWRGAVCLSAVHKCVEYRHSLLLASVGFS